MRTEGTNCPSEAVQNTVCPLGTWVQRSLASSSKREKTPCDSTNVDLVCRTSFSCCACHGKGNARRRHFHRNQNLVCRARERLCPQEDCVNFSGNNPKRSQEIEAHLPLRRCSSGEYVRRTDMQGLVKHAAMAPGQPVTRYWRSHSHVLLSIPTVT